MFIFYAFNCILLFRNGILLSGSHESMMHRQYLCCGSSETSYRQSILRGVSKTVHAFAFHSSEFDFQGSCRCEVKADSVLLGVCGLWTHICCYNPCHLAVLPSSFTVATESGGLVTYFWLALEILILAMTLIHKRIFGTMVPDLMFWSVL